VARSVRQRCPALQQVRPEALHRQSGRTKRREGALAALLEGELTALVAAPVHLGLAQATLEGGMAGQENSMQELGLLHDDPATSPRPRPVSWMWCKPSPHQTQSNVASGASSLVASPSRNSRREPTGPRPTSSRAASTRSVDGSMPTTRPRGPIASASQRAKSP